MNFSICVRQHQINKVLDYLSNYKLSNGKIYIDDKFYSGLKPLSKVKIIQILNAMEAENIITKYPPKYPQNCPYLTLTVDAFAYKMHRRKDIVRFLIPTIISVIALLKAFDVELVQLWKLLTQVQK